MTIKKRKIPPDYKGQPREANGRFSRGKQTGSKSQNRAVSAGAARPRYAGIHNTAPYNVPRPKHRPGEVV